MLVSIWCFTFPMFPSQACWNQFLSISKILSINLPAFSRLFEGVLHALQSLCMPAHMTFCTTCTSKESNIDESWWRRDVAANGNRWLLSKHCQLAFRQYCVNAREDVWIFGYVLYSSTGRNDCHLSLFFHFQVSSPPLKNDGFRQLGLLFPIYGKKTSCSKPPTRKWI